MAVSNSLTPKFNGVDLTPVILLANSSQGTGNSVPPLTQVVEVQGVVNDANDFIVLPSLASVPNGHQILIIASAGANFELRTPSASAEEINSEDCDGTKEALLTDTNIYFVTKIDNTIGWMLEGRTAIGAYQTAIIPD
jgi:hypothetical protein